MKRTKVVLLFFAFTTASLAFVHPFGNPRVASAEPREGLLTHSSLPADAKNVLLTKCADCHSNSTRWPIYGRLAPGSWLMERDVMRARGEMNFSLWDTLPSDSQEVFIAKIIAEAKRGDMPPLQYRAVHWAAGLTTADVAALSGMEHRTAGVARAAGNAVHGKDLFERRCTGCHAMEGNREGPKLAGVFGRKAGTVPGFDYSPGLKKSGIVWDEASLEKWLSDPQSVTADARMDFYVGKAQDRADLIAYLKH